MPAGEERLQGGVGTSVLRQRLPGPGGMGRSRADTKVWGRGSLQEDDESRALEGE